MEFTYIIFGWLLGILSPGIIDFIKNERDRKKVKKTIISELSSVRKRLILVPFTVYKDYSDLNAKFCEWLTKQVKFLDGDEPDNIFKRIFSQDNEAISAFILSQNEQERSISPSFSFKKMETGVVDSHLINIGLLNDTFLKQLLDIKFQIQVYNEEIQNVNEYLKMTFDSNITNTNHQIITEAIRKVNYKISERAIIVVDMINLLIND